MRRYDMTWKTWGKIRMKRLYKMENIIIIYIAIAMSNKQTRNLQ